MAKKRKYPVGIQSFEKIRREGYVYVDKTALIYKMITEGCPYFLSRPRRFGKSLLVSTLAAVFEGRRELFEAFTTEDGTRQPQLYIARSDWRWEQYPVVRFDFSKEMPTVKELDEIIDSRLGDYERLYGLDTATANTSLRMERIVIAAHQQTGRRAVVLCDEYDNMMLHSIGDPERQKAVRERFQMLFSPLKSLDDHLQFVFITGISKFSQMGVFSKINQLNNISMLSQYEELCGISESELTTVLHDDIALLGEQLGLSYEEALAALKQNYDGYHFGSRMADIYNPFSLFNALYSAEIKDYWFASGTPGALLQMLSQMPPLEVKDVDEVRCQAVAFDVPFDSYQNPLPALYQSGYLTIRRYRPDHRMFVLGFPNQEVRTGFADCLYQYITQTQPNDRSRSVFLNAYYDFMDSGDLSQFVQALKAFYASVPYVLDNRNEHHYQTVLYTLLLAFGADVVAEEMSAQGRSDIVLRMPGHIYILETKYGAQHTAREALQQIDQCGYGEKYALEGRPVTKVGMVFGAEERNITDWEARS